MAALTVEQLRADVVTDASDDRLQELLDAAWDDVAGVIGPEGERTIRAFGGSRFLFLPAATIAAEVSAVVETVGATDYTLADNDWLLWHDGVTLERRYYGTNPALGWQGSVAVTFTPNDDTARRRVAQRALVELELNRNPGVRSRQIGSWSESYGAPEDYATAKAAILAALVTSTPLTFS